MPASRCADRACSPPLGNLASGRALFTLSGCCGNSSSLSLCQYPPAQPHLCMADAHPSYPSSHMTDDPFLRPDTWWSSSAGSGAADEIRLDMETRFYLSHVILIFMSPRPAAMAIQRSADFGRTWETLKLFARNCSAEFALPDDVTQTGSPCTSRYTSASPCMRGEVRRDALMWEFCSCGALDVFFSPPQVILRLLDPSMSPVLDPYSPEAVARLTLTNLRIRLLKAQSCPPPAETSYPGPTLTSAAPYAVSTLLARGTCLCHGHSDRCVPHNSSRDQGRGPNMVSRFSVEFKSKSIF